MAKVKNKLKKKAKSEAVSVKSKAVKKLNPFEVHINRQKHKILGRESKHDVGLPGVSRAKAIQKRKATLLQEYRIQNKSNRFLDKRIGERNITMTAEERAMARFTAERVKTQNKKSMFNLADDEVLTHRGQTLSEIEKFDDPRSDDEADGDKLDAEFVEEAHFGGFMKKVEGESKSRKDLIAELILESKKRKAEKQKDQERTHKLTEKLDSDWKDLLPIVASSKKSQNEEAEVGKADSYDIVMRELKFEARGKPTDRLKTEEELVVEEKERLEKLEEERLMRMKGFVEDSSDAPKHRSADDLDDGLDIEPETKEIAEESTEDNVKEPLSENEVEENVEHENDEGNKSEDEDGNKSEDEEVDSKDDDEEAEDSFSDLKTDDSEEEDEVQSQKEAKKQTRACESDEPRIERVQEIKATLLAKKEMMEAARKELPYTFSVPTVYEDLHSLLQKYNPDYQSVVLERMIKCNHPSLGNMNKEKLQNLFAFLLQYIHDVASSDKQAENVPYCFLVLDRLAPHLYDLAQISAKNAKQCVTEVLKEKWEDFKKQGRRTYPRLDTFIFLKLIPVLFPTSDFRHPVTTPALVFMTQMLGQCKVKSASDIAFGLYLCTLMLEYTALSKKFSPEAINFLRGVIYLSIPKDSRRMKSVPGPFRLVGSEASLLVLAEEQAQSESDWNFMKLSDLLRDSITEDFKVRAVWTAVKLSAEFVSHLEELSSALQIFEPVMECLVLMPKDKYPQALQDEMDEVVQRIKQLNERKLEYLVLEKKRPKALKLYEPKFEQVYEGKKFKVMSKEKQEREKLMHKYKREMKGAIREIRRDSSFLAKQQLKEQIGRDMERKRKVKELMGSLAAQEGDYNSMKRKQKWNK